jgi:hypothetical protein
MTNTTNPTVTRWTANYGGVRAIFVRAQAGRHIAIRVSPENMCSSIIEVYLVDPSDGLEMYRGTAEEVTMRPEMLPVIRAAAGVHCPWYLAA